MKRMLYKGGSSSMGSSSVLCGKVKGHIQYCRRTNEWKERVSGCTFSPWLPQIMMPSLSRFHFPQIHPSELPSERSPPWTRAAARTSSTYLKFKLNIAFRVNLTDFCCIAKWDTADFSFSKPNIKKLLFCLFNYNLLHVILCTHFIHIFYACYTLVPGIIAHSLTHCTLFHFHLLSCKLIWM